MGGAKRALLLSCLALAVVAAWGAAICTPAQASEAFPLEVQLDASSIDCYASQPFVLNGRVVANDTANATLVPIADAAVDFAWLDAPSSAPANATTGADGRFALDLLGPVDPGDYLGQVTARVIWAGQTSPAYNFTINVTADTTPRELHVFLMDPPTEVGFREATYLTGRVTKSAYAGWNETPAAGIQVTPRWTDPSLTDPMIGNLTDSDGNFVLTIFGTTLPNSYEVEVEASDPSGVLSSGSATFNFTQQLPGGLVVLVDPDSLHFTPAVGGAFVVKGTVMYFDPEGNPVGPAENALVEVIFVNPPQPDMPPSARADANGRFQITVLGRNTPKTYSLNVAAHDDVLGLNAPPVGVTAVVGSPPTSLQNTTTSQQRPLLDTPTAILSAVGVAGVGAALYVWLRPRRPPTPPGAPPAAPPFTPR